MLWHTKSTTATCTTATSSPNHAWHTTLFLVESCSGESARHNNSRRGRQSQAAGRDPFHADSHPSFLLLPFPQTLPSAFIQTGIQIFAKHETNFKMSKNNFLAPNSSINSKRLFIFQKNPATGFLHFCNRSQSHSWSLVSSRGHFNEALLPWRKKTAAFKQQKNVEQSAEFKATWNAVN